jgi:hypothetical protein
MAPHENGAGGSGFMSRSGMFPETGADGPAVAVAAALLCALVKSGLVG